MPEVFTISGPFGAPACPPGWKATAKGNCGGAKGPSPAAAAVQKALQALGRKVGDAALIRVTADGVIGPGTAAAVNRAFTVHIGAGQVSAQLRTGRLSIYDVALSAAAIVQGINQEIIRRGGAPAPTTVARTARPEARPVPSTTATVACPAGWTRTAKGNCAGAPARALQTALQSLGRVAGDSLLVKVAVDGIVGPGTVAAVNRAFTKHIGAGQAPAAYRTGTLTTFNIASLAPQITQYLTNEIVRRGGRRPPPLVAKTVPGGARRPATTTTAPGPRTTALVPRTTTTRPPVTTRPPGVPAPTTTAEETPGAGQYVVPTSPDDVFRTVPGASTPSAAEAAPGADAIPGGEAPKRSPWVWVAVAGGVVAVGAAAYFLTRGGKQKRLRQEGFSPEEAAAVAGVHLGGGFGEVTKKDFQAIADVLCSHGAGRPMISAFSRYFSTQNPRFNASRFEKAAMSCPAYRQAA